jgi:hypothetical protein
VSYYAAGGYYRAGSYYRSGGFSFKKLGRFIGKVASSPIGQLVAGAIPGASTALTAINAGKALFKAPAAAPAAAQAVASSGAGTPGANAFYGVPGGYRGSGRYRTRIRRRRRRY